MKDIKKIDFYYDDDKHYIIEINNSIRFGITKKEFKELQSGCMSQKIYNYYKKQLGENNE